MYRVVTSAKHNALLKKANEYCLFVKEVTLGKAIRHRRMDIRARGKTGVRRTPISSIRIVLEEKTLTELYKLLISGNCPPGLAARQRKNLIENGAGVEEIFKQTHITTARGRFEQRRRFKRELKVVHEKMCRETGKQLALSVTNKIYMNQLGRTYSKGIRERNAAISQKSLKNRKRMYKINQMEAEE